MVSKPGAAEVIGTSAAARAKPDGYTLLALPLTAGILTQEFHQTDYNVLNFEAIYGWFEGPMDVIVNANSPFKDLSELIAAGQEKTLKVATVGVGDISHLNSLLLEKMTGIKTKAIPYDGGGPAVGAVLKGEVDFFTAVGTTSVRFVKGKRIRQLAILGPERLGALPETPTIYELGYKDWPYIPFIRAALAPPKTPQDRVKILETAFKKAVDDPEFRARMKKQGRPVKAFTSQQMKETGQKIAKITTEYVPFMKEALKKKE
jgi:tripartite-type tricarboxylate transporter receptor subunit TctC